jgi:predicted ATPase
MLLVLDNLEHVLEAGPELARLLASCPELTVIATSRTPLQLRAEHVVRVPPLALPPAQAEVDLQALGQIAAVQLFVDRAAAHSEFRLQPQNARDVLEICRRLDALPLAIELAAARTAQLSPAMILALLIRPLDLLVGGSRDLPARHQTLRDAIAWSYHLLSPDEQRVFRTLAVFAGGATIPLAAEVAMPGQDPFLTLGYFTALSNWGLVRIVPHRASESRVSLLETIREFALEHLVEAGELPATQRAHATVMMTVVEAMEPGLLGAEQAANFAILDAEQDNVRAALAWATAEAERNTTGVTSTEVTIGAAELALRLACAMWWYWETRGYFSEGQKWLKRALARESWPATVLHGKALWRAGALAYRRHDLDQADADRAKAFAILQAHGDHEGIAWCQAFLGLVALVRNEPEAARQWHEGALASARLAGDEVVQAGSLSNLGEVTHAEGDLAGAAGFYTQALEIARELPDKLIMARTLTNVAIVRV